MSKGLVKIYECLCDETRLRILNLLCDGPLCVCHFQEILKLPQVKVSRHLAYLRERGMVEVEKMGNWRVYRLPRKSPDVLRRHLACLQDCAREETIFKQDAQRRERLDLSAFSATCFK